jgi:hypothetical protein
MDRVRRCLDRIRLLWWFLVVGRGVLRWCAGVVVLLVVGLALSRVVPLAVSGLLLLAWAAATALLAYREWARLLWRPPSREHAAAQVERSYPGTRLRLLGAVQLDEDRAEGLRLGYDVHLLDAAVADGVRSMDGVRAAVALRPQWLAARNALLVLLGVGAIAGGLAAAGILSADALRAWVRSPREALLLEIVQVQPGDASVGPGEDVPVRAQLRGSVRAPVLLEFREAGGKWRDIRMERGGIRYEATLQNVVSPMEYRVRVGGKSSAVYSITVGTPPVMASLSVALHFPAYSGLGVKTLEENQGDITALVGTRAEVRGRSAATLSGARLDFDELPDVPLSASRADFSGEFVVEKSDRYTLSLTGADGATHGNPPRYLVTAVEDELPQVTVRRPGADITLDRGMLVPLEVEAMDDFGVSSVVLRFEGKGEKQTGAISLRSVREAAPFVRVEHAWDLNPLDLFSNDVVTYYIEVFDNDTVSGPKRAVSPTYSIRFPSMVELFDELTRSQNAQAEMMSSLVESQKGAEDIVDALIDRLRKEQELTLREQKDIERAVQMQQQIEAKRQELVQEVERSLREAEKNSLVNLETLQKVEEMRRLLDEVASEELKEALRKLQEALSETRLSEQQRRLMEANFQQEEFRQRIEQMIAMLQKMQAQQEVEKALKMAEALVQEQKRVVEQTEEMNRALGERRPEARSPEAEQTSRLAEQERRIGEGTRELREQMERTSERLRADANLRRVGEEVERIHREAESANVERDLDRAREEFRRRSPQGAQPPATSALEQLQAMRQGLDNANDFMQGEGGEQTMAALREAVRDTLHLSRAHEEVLSRTSGLNAGSGRASREPNPQAAELGVQEQAIAEGVNAVAQTLAALGEREIRVPLELVWRLRSAAEGLQRGTRALTEDGPSRALPIQRQALAELNTAAFQMLQAMDALNAQMGSGGLANMMEQLQQLAEGQGDLNRMAEQLQEQIRQQGTSASGQQTLERMAFEQNLIRQATERLAEKLDRLKEVLGDLGGLADEMEQVEQRLDAADLNRDVLERMRRIETRMLESARSLQKRQTGNERKSATARRLFDEQTGTENPDWQKLRQTLGQEWSNLAEADAPEAYRALIRAYFRALTEQKGALP